MMNERIKELAEKSGLITHEVPNGLAHLHTMVDVEKFAELIIKECMNQCFTEDSDRIRKHFGIE